MDNLLPLADMLDKNDREYALKCHRRFAREFEAKGASPELAIKLATWIMQHVYEIDMAEWLAE